MKTAVRLSLKAHLWRLAIISLSLFGVHQDLQAKESSGMQWTVTRHTWGEDLSGSLQGAGGIGGLLSSTVDGSPTKNQEQRTTNGFHYDGNGNVILLTNAKAQETARYSYDAFGKTLTATGPAAEQNRYQFSTKPAEEGSSLMYYGYRWYDPVTGRWPSRDPIEERGGFNLYVMTRNSVNNMSDLLGAATWVATGVQKCFDGDIHTYLKVNGTSYGLYPADHENPFSGQGIIASPDPNDHANASCENLEVNTDCVTAGSVAGHTLAYIQELQNSGVTYSLAYSCGVFAVDAAYEGVYKSKIGGFVNSCKCAFAGYNRWK